MMDASVLTSWIGNSVVIQVVMSVLLLASFVSWWTIFLKWLQNGAATRQMAHFEALLSSSTDLAALHRTIVPRVDQYGPAARLFCAAMRERVRLTEDKRDASFLVRAERAMQDCYRTEVEKFESYLSILATVGSVSPYIGLLGTVWGVMHAFRQLLYAHSTALALVAPGIAESLIATAMGLVAAIPAVVAYNYCITRVDHLALRLSSFQTGFLNTLQYQDAL